MDGLRREIGPLTWRSKPRAKRQKGQSSSQGNSPSALSAKTKEIESWDFSRREK
jgi:hypothetical protein